MANNRRVTQTCHPLELPRPVAAFGIMGLWAVGVALIDPHAVVGAILCVVAVGWTVWLYSAELSSMRVKAFQTWPWIGIIIIAIELVVPAYLLCAKFVQPAYPSVLGTGPVKSKPTGRSIFETTTGGEISARGAQLPTNPCFTIGRAETGGKIILDQSKWVGFDKPCGQPSK